VETGKCGATCGSAEHGGEPSPKGDNVVDAEFDEVKNEKK